MTPINTPSLQSAARSYVSEQRSYIGIVLFCGLCGLILPTFNSDMNSTTTDHSDLWVLPHSQSVELTSSVANMLANPLFGGEPVVLKTEEAPEDADPVSNWRLIGIVREGANQKILLIEDGETRLKEAILGDRLPGGEKLISISENTIEIESDDGKAQISLFQNTANSEE